MSRFNSVRTGSSRSPQHQRPGSVPALRSEEAGVGGEGAGEPELVPHQYAEEPLWQGFGVRRGPRHAGAQQNLPSSRGRKIRNHFLSSVPSRAARLVLQRRQQSGLNTSQQNTSVFSARLKPARWDLFFSLIAKLLGH